VSELIGSSEESSLKPVLYGVVWKRTSSNTKNSASGPKNTVSPTPIDFTIASAFLAMPRGFAVVGLAGGRFQHVADDDHGGPRQRTDRSLR